MSPKGSDDPLGAIRRFARPAYDGRRELDPFLCRHLSAKNWSLGESGSGRAASRSAASSQYWCLRTMRLEGPDGGIALPDRCTDERVCFEPALRQGSDS